MISLELPSPQQDFSAMSINGPSLPTLTDINFNNGHQTIENGNQSVNSTVPELPMVLERFCIQLKLEFYHDCCLS